MTCNPSVSAADLDGLSINTIRTLSMDAIQKANSGHPGAPMGLAPVGYLLWTRFLKHHPRKPDWLDRDRFVLSGGHASMLLYSLLYLTGYDLSLDDLKDFRQWKSRTPGHPELGVTPGVETTTGPLGQGFANAVGMAMAERHLAARFNRPQHTLVDHHTWVICGDGDLMEGVSAEAASLAGHLGLGRLICIYDDNQISIEGRTDISFTEDVGRRFEAYHWHVVRVADGNDLAELATALQAAKDVTDKPSLVMVRTHIAYGSPNKQDSADAHGAPLGEEEVCLTKTCLGCNPDDRFCVPEAVLAHCRETISRGEAAEAAWMETFNAYRQAYPDLADAWLNAVCGYMSSGWDTDLPVFTPQDGPMATRAASGKVLNAIADCLPTLMGGSGDLAPSNKTFINGSPEFQKESYEGRNVRFGVREHAMGAILNGLYLHHGIRPYGGTFLVFADYMRPAIRMASLMKLPVIYIFTHDSIAVGEDGPTHQPVEHLAALRAIPNLTVIRPADANETVEAWKMAVSRCDGPSALVLSRQKLPVLDPSITRGKLIRGGYVVADGNGVPELILIATGAEVHLALKAGEVLKKRGVAVRVVNLPSWELFERAGADYRRTVLPPEVKARLAIEAGVGMGWERYVGEGGAVVSIEHFGASAPGGVLMEKFGFTVDNVVQKALAMIDKAV
ncbi:MAG: transketolase [Desulfobacterales bacterium]|jgi:transketolase|nr:transketolase [Desulfobacteraceae bacterium]MDY0312085.1 transketolase [Desulfobacterales bacterium]